MIPLVASLCLATLAAAATQQASAPSGGASRWNVVPLTYDCDQQMDVIVDELYLSANATDVTVNGNYLCNDDCRDDCASMLKPLFQGYYDKLCPPEELIRRCLQVAPSNWTDFVADCEYFSNIGGTMPTYTRAQLNGGQGGGRAGTGCFPGFQEADDFGDWLKNNFTSTPNPMPAPPPSLGPVVSGFHFPVSKPAKNSDCDLKLARVLDESYFGPLSADLPQELGPACDDACRTRCGIMIKKVFNGTTPAKESCPAYTQLRDCMAVARPQWLDFVRVCEGLEKGIPPRAYKATGNVIGGEAEAEGRRRLLSVDMLGEDPFWAEEDFEVPSWHSRHLLHGLEGEGEHEGARYASYDELHVTPRLLAEEGEANSGPLPTMVARGPAHSPITQATSAFTRAAAPSPAHSNAAPGPAPRIRASSGQSEARNRGEAAGEAGEGRRRLLAPAAPSPAPRIRASSGQSEARNRGEAAGEAGEGRRRILSAPAPGPLPRVRSANAAEARSRSGEAGEAGEGRRRLGEPAWRSDEGEHEVWTAAFEGEGQHAQQLRSLLSEAEREGEREGRIAGVLGTSSLRGSEAVLQPRYRTLLAEALEGEAARVALPSLEARGPAKAPLNPMAPATSAFSRAGALYSYNPPMASPSKGEAEGEGEASEGEAGAAKGAAAEGEAGEGLSAAVQDPREVGCLPDFHTWGDFDAWLQGNLTIAPRPAPDHGQPSAIALVSVCVFTVGMFGLAFF